MSGIGSPHDAMPFFATACFFGCHRQTLLYRRNVPLDTLLHFSQLCCSFPPLLLALRILLKIPTQKSTMISTRQKTASSRLIWRRFTYAKSVGTVNILVGPDQDPQQFQFRPNDKVICDFDQPGTQMGGNTPKFSCKITKVESHGRQSSDSQRPDARAIGQSKVRRV